MAKPTLITKLSRRAMLARGALAAALSAAVLPSATRAAPPRVTGRTFDGPALDGPDGPLLQRVALAEMCWAAYDRAEAEHDRLYEAQRRHPDCPRAPFDTPEAGAAWDGLAERHGILALEARCLHLSTLCDTATQAAFNLPAHTLAGTHAKLRLAVAALKAEYRGSVDPPDCSYLDSTLADLDRVAGGRTGDLPRMLGQGL